MFGGVRKASSRGGGEAGGCVGGRAGCPRHEGGAAATVDVGAVGGEEERERHPLLPSWRLACGRGSEVLSTARGRNGGAADAGGHGVSPLGVGDWCARAFREDEGEIACGSLETRRCVGQTGEAVLGCGVVVSAGARPSPPGGDRKASKKMARRHVSPTEIHLSEEARDGEAVRLRRCGGGT